MGGRPNVLLIMTDEQRFDAVGCNGNPHVKTPHLDRLAAEGVNFQGHMCSSPICTPARASILTGQYPRTHGARMVGAKLDPASATLATWLTAAGYECGLFGKSHLEGETTNFNWHDRKHERYYGFQEALLSEDNIIGPYLHWIRREHPEWEQVAWLQANEEMQQPIGYGKDGDGRLLATRAIELPVELTQSAWITRQTEGFIRDRAKRKQPFFAVCSYVPPHHPFTPPVEYARRYDAGTMPSPRRARPEYATPMEAMGAYARIPGISDDELRRMKAHYYALCTMLDYQIGKLLATVEDAGVEEDTLVIFTSDHGDYLGDHGLIRKGGVMFDNILRVPLIMRLPGTKGGRICQGPTQHEDLAPTVLELLGLPGHNVIQGRSLAKMVRGESRSPREFAYFEHPNFDGCGISDGRFKLLRYPTCQSWVLVDTRDDPMELTNRLDSPEAAGAAERLRAGLLTWLADTPLKMPHRPVTW